jgi:hypothetical protein
MAWTREAGVQPRGPLGQGAGRGRRLPEPARGRRADAEHQAGGPA